MSTPIHKQLGYHRILLCFGILILWFIFPDEKPRPAVGGEGFMNAVDWGMWHYRLSVFSLYFMGWLSLSDMLANLWRLAEFLMRKAPHWFYLPLFADLAMIAGLWFTRYTYLVEKVEEVTQESLHLIQLIPLLG